MTTNDAYDRAMLAIWSGTAATPEQVSAVRSLRDDVRELAEDLAVGARTELPEAPVEWCSPAGTAYAEVLVGLRETLGSIAAELVRAEGGLSSCAHALQTRVDDLDAALAMRPAS
ncbi:hypothetical protein SAMN05428970_0157 [Agromyces sp. CF514]|uniref:hypothetical protein n=1 Tax=Agromyces sp. CF514 TaxID=1881031 RepID=UPI0008F2D4FA|nr:hypothetical protein [Agromyces sp. CF514]SFR67128.1 hypothetical protein SAMN05428970_0157 [Agromyces sp. CF514]